MESKRSDIASAKVMTIKNMVQTIVSNFSEKEKKMVARTSRLFQFVVSDQLYKDCKEANTGCWGSIGIPEDIERLRIARDKAEKNMNSASFAPKKL